jgi:hypothetical protein
MDLGFFINRERLVRRSAARVEYRVLVATLEAMQTATASARAEVVANGQGSDPGVGQDPLVELVLGGSAWRDAIVAQGGCFHAAHARNRGNAM